MVARQLTDRLEHRHSPAGADDEARVDQAPERLGSRAADGEGGLLRPSSGEDGQALERTLLGRIEQVEAPLDRGANGHLPRRRVARSLDQNTEA
jgi:hypothetical protein